MSINSQRLYVSVQKYQLQVLQSRQKLSLLLVNEYFSSERNTANGTLWTDTI